MNTLQKKSYFSLFVIVLLQILFFYLVYLEYKGEKQLVVITQTDKVDQNFKKQTIQLSDLIGQSQAHFNQYVLFRELPELKAYNDDLVLLSSHLNELVTDKNQSASLRSKLKNNMMLNNSLIALKQKTDSLINYGSTTTDNINLDAILKPSEYRFEDVLNSVEFETDKKVDSVKKKGFFSRIGSAMKGETDVQKEQINSKLKMKFGKKVVSGDIKQQFKNVLMESQKHYNKQFSVLGKSLANIKKGEKNLIDKNTALIRLYKEINTELTAMIDGVLDDNNKKMEQQAKLNKTYRFYLIVTVLVLILFMLTLLLKYINDTFRIKKELSIAKEQISKDLILKNRIIATLTHEIKTPVSIINLYGAFMGNKNNDPELKEFFDTVTYTSNTLMHISSQAVELVKSNEGGVTLNLEKVDLALETQAIVKSLMIFANSKNIAINFDNQLPTQYEVQYDKAKFYQLVYNIVGNAIKFAKSVIEITARLEQVEEKQQFVFLVKDDGIGIPTKDQERIFDLEYQSSNNKTVDALSFGLGLYLCQNIVKASNGALTVVSEVNKGTEITFNLNLNK